MKVPHDSWALHVLNTSPSHLGQFENTQSNILFFPFIDSSLSSEVRRASESGICGSKFRSVVLTGIVRIQRLENP